MPRRSCIGALTAPWWEDLAVSGEAFQWVRPVGRVGADEEAGRPHDVGAGGDRLGGGQAEAARSCRELPRRWRGSTARRGAAGRRWPARPIADGGEAADERGLLGEWCLVEPAPLVLGRLQRDLDGASGDAELHGRRRERDQRRSRGGVGEHAGPGDGETGPGVGAPGRYCAPTEVDVVACCGPQPEGVPRRSDGDRSTG